MSLKTKLASLLQEVARTTQTPRQAALAEMLAELRLLADEADLSYAAANRRPIVLADEVAWEAPACRAVA